MEPPHVFFCSRISFANSDQLIFFYLKLFIFSPPISLTFSLFFYCLLVISLSFSVSFPHYSYPLLSLFLSTLFLPCFLLLSLISLIPFLLYLFLSLIILIHFLYYSLSLSLFSLFLSLIILILFFHCFIILIFFPLSSLLPFSFSIYLSSTHLDPFFKIIQPHFSLHTIGHHVAYYPRRHLFNRLHNPFSIEVHWEFDSPKTIALTEWMF